MKALRENIGISHLFFVDDLILFAKVSEKGSEAVKDVLNKFCEDSGQMISYEKSWICFSPNIPTNLKEKVCENLSIQATSNLGKYLGQFNFVVDRMLTKLAEWKIKFLSFAGRTFWSNQSQLPSQTMLCKGWLYLHIFVTSLTESIGTSYGARQ